jgi:ParB-like chromosome segregation protein Spo0J
MAEELGISAPTVTRALALLRLPEDIQQAVDAGALPPRTAAEIGTLDNPAERRELALEALSRDMTRDQVSEAVQKRKAARGLPRKGRKPSKPTITPGNATTITPGNARAITPGNDETITPGNGRGEYRFADGTRVSIQGPRQGSPESRLEALRETIAMVEAELAEQGGDAQAA